MKEYPNYRAVVEVVLVKDGKVLLTKRAKDCVVAPNKWNVPAGKVKYEEIPVDACLREAKEEVQLDVDILNEIGVRAFKGYDANNEVTFRLVYTYLVQNKDDNKDPIIDEEHSEFCWVSKAELDNDKFDSMNPKLKQILKDNLN